jgi:Fe2+ or Zn2+ uptake regulation protein
MTVRGRNSLTAEEIRERVRAAGLRVTAPRVAVIQQLQTAQAPITHAELATALASQGWDRATIYRNLTDLTEAKLLQRTDVGDHVWRFELYREQGGADHADALTRQRKGGRLSERLEARELDLVQAHARRLPAACTTRRPKAASI